MAESIDESKALAESVETRAPFGEEDLLGYTAATSSSQLGVSWAAPAVAADDRYVLAEGAAAGAYPRVLTAFEMLQESDDESVFCGPPSDAEERGVWEFRALEVWGIGTIESNRRRLASRGLSGVLSGETGRGGDGEARFRNAGASGAPKKPGAARPTDVERRPSLQLIHLPGEVQGDNQKFICVFQVGLEDDEEFCLVKRILGKAGNNMRRIAEECNAKVRLRGIGSGFLEGSDGREANMPLQLNVSCVDYETYARAVDQVAFLLRDLYKHYRRYRRSKGQEPPDLKLVVEEVRRDDLHIDLLAQKAQRSPSQRERERRAREQERRYQREPLDLTPAPASVDTAFGGSAGGGRGWGDGGSGGGFAWWQQTGGWHDDWREDGWRENAGNWRSSWQPWGEDVEDSYSGCGSAAPSGMYAASASADGDGSAAAEGFIIESPARRSGGYTLPGGQPIPTTAAGRRAVARTGGAAAAAIVSAAAREAERDERERAREQREQDRGDGPKRRMKYVEGTGRFQTRDWEEEEERGGTGQESYARGAPPPPPGPPPDHAVPIGSYEYAEQWRSTSWKSKWQTKSVAK